MNQKEFVNIALIGLVIVAMGVIGYFMFIQKPNPIIQPPFGDSALPASGDSALPTSRDSALPALGNSALSEIKYEDLSTFGSQGSLACISIANANKEFIVTTEAEYQNLINYRSPFSKCTNFVLPPIDFSQKTLLGKYASGGCSVYFAKKVYKNDSNKKIIYVIDVIEQGACESMIFSSNWILIPKIPSDYTVEFQVK